MLAEGTVGPPVASIAPSMPVGLRMGNTRGLITHDAHGRFYEAAYRGSIFSAITAATGVAPGTAISTTAAFTLFNPKASTVNLSILRGSMLYLSGTLGIGFVQWCANVNLAEAVPTGTAITALCGNRRIGNVANGTALTTATLAVAPLPVRNFGTLPPILASSVTAPWLLADQVDGTILLPPGGAVSLMAIAAAGTSPLVLYEVTWEEIPL